MTSTSPPPATATRAVPTSRSTRRAKIPSTVALAAALPALSTIPAAAADWPQWRGPNRDGHAQVAAPASWPAKLTERWRITVGGGHANPVVVGDRVYLHARDGEEETVSAHALVDGKRLWQDRYPLPFQPTQEALPHGKGPFATPLLADGVLYTFGMDQVLTAYRASDGTRLWRNDYRTRYPVARPYYGNSFSPLLADGNLVVYVGGPGKGALLALDPTTGQERWRREGDGPPYASPLLVELAGVRQILTQTQASVAGYAVTTGQRLWSLPYQVDWDNTIVTPAVAGSRFFLSAYAKPLVALEVSAQGSALAVAERWSENDLGLYMSSPVLAGGRLWVFTRTKKGQLVAVDPASGERRWSSEPGLGEHASLVVLGDQLLVLGSDATLRVFATAGEGAPRQLATFEVASSPTWSHPVPLADGLLVRDAGHLVRWAY
jgi:outer membrane protein assembly factor BamB